jgi:hypothetical protein
LDETKKAIKKTEAKREISNYIRVIGDLQEDTIQATKEIGYDCLITLFFTSDEVCVL